MIQCCGSVHAHAYSGQSVGAGMTVLVSILISELVPIRESGTWRSYVNIAATTGRGFGGPLGGLLADTVGWRWYANLHMSAVALTRNLY
jgi:MFS family permease